MQQSFKRYEKKYLLTVKEYKTLLPIVKENMVTDKYGEYTICNIYFDTDTYELIRKSVEKPVYKEKFRLRSYGTPDENGLVFAEIKKKFKGIVYKRRISGTPKAISSFIKEEKPLEKDTQIQNEIMWLFHNYHPVPKVFIGYDRMAFTEKDGGSLRLTFDKNIRWRTENLDLCAGDNGELVLDEEKIVLEIKADISFPNWLITVLNENHIYPTSFSKYGTCYKNHIAKNLFKECLTNVR